jgi:hypothetical protein
MVRGEISQNVDGELRNRVKPRAGDDLLEPVVKRARDLEGDVGLGGLPAHSGRPPVGVGVIAVLLTTLLWEWQPDSQVARQHLGILRRVPGSRRASKTIVVHTCPPALRVATPTWRKLPRTLARWGGDCMNARCARLTDPA